MVFGVCLFGDGGGCGVSEVGQNRGRGKICVSVLDYFNDFKCYLVQGDIFCSLLK